MEEKNNKNLNEELNEKNENLEILKLTLQYMNLLKNKDFTEKDFLDAYKMFQKEAGIEKQPQPRKRASIPAVPIEESVHDDFIICLEDGVKCKILSKYIKKFDLTKKEYIKRWNLPYDYPFVCNSLSKQRREIAKQSKLGLTKKKKSKHDR